MSEISATELSVYRSAGRRIVMTTAYDATMAALVDPHVDAILVGDSLGMVVQGYQDTLQVTLDDVIYHTRAVSRSTRHAHVVADLPFMSYQLSAKQALASAGRLVREGGAQSVKLEGGSKRIAKSVARIVDAGIPVMGHVGLTPQSVNAIGGFKLQGRDAAAAERILDEAHRIQEAGAYAIVLEMIPAELAGEISQTLQIPTIGIGAGEHCHGQVLVSTDLLGMNPKFKPRFVKRYADLATTVSEAFETFAEEVRRGSFPDARHSYPSRKLSVVGSSAESPYGAPVPIEREMTS